MKNKTDIYKAAAVIIKDRMILVVRSQKNPSVLIAPGGKVKPLETPIQTIIRELQEELNIEVDSKNMDLLGTYYAQAAGNESLSLKMDVFWIKSWEGQIRASREIDELFWINSQSTLLEQVGSIFAHEVVPQLVKQGLVD